jgi:hypothetical protein
MQEREEMEKALGEAVSGRERRRGEGDTFSLSLYLPLSLSTTHTHTLSLSLFLLLSLSPSKTHTDSVSLKHTHSFFPPSLSLHTDDRGGASPGVAHQREGLARLDGARTARADHCRRKNRAFRSLPQRATCVTAPESNVRHSSREQREVITE